MCSNGGFFPRWGEADLRGDAPLRNLRTEETVSRVADERLDFGLIRSDAVRESVESAEIGTIKYAIVVPRRLLRRNLPPDGIGRAAAVYNRHGWAAHRTLA